MVISRQSSFGTSKGEGDSVALDSVGGSQALELEDNDSFSNDEEKPLEKTLAKRESRFVCGLKLLIYAVLIVATIVVALVVYWYISNAEQRRFETQFISDSGKILQAVGTQLEMTMGALDFLVVSYVSYARATEAEWPRVTLPDIAVRAEKVMRLTNVMYIDVYPMVMADNRLAWENYTAEHGPEYINQTNNFMLQSGIWFEGQFFNISDTYFRNDIHYTNYTDDGWAGLITVPYDEPGPFMPRWQGHAPLSYAPYNLDYLVEMDNKTMIKAMETHECVIGDTYKEDDISWLHGGASGADMFSQIIYPIIPEVVEYLRVRESLPDYDPAEHTLLGTLAATIIWSDMLASILPEGSDGIRVYFDDSCGNNFTYQVDGPKVTFLGLGDYHEEQYNYLGESENLLDLDERSTRARELFEYTGLPINEEYCPWVLQVYPSSTMHDRFMTDNPAIFTAVSVLIFVFTSFVFIMYDWYVERRQKIVLGSAVRSGEVVASFYPKAIRERIYGHKEAQKKAEEPTKRWKAAGAAAKQRMSMVTRRSTAGSSTGDSAADMAEAAAATSISDAPIADFYPETTVMFADIAGFTSWSSTREAAAVFILLEGLYQEFDKIAKRRGVFKIETIGDCYLAVCGLPKARKNHAVVMARFAAECRDMFNAKTPELEIELGPGTADLLLRAGLHSGSCTGGVLRGDKCLFTLFGDTVNTASRMESNGRPNFVQVSQATADLLIEAGKESWLTKREDLVTAKGKGKMQTYWVEPSQGTGSAGTLSDHDRRMSRSYSMDSTDESMLAAAAAAATAADDETPARGPSEMEREKSMTRERRARKRDGTKPSSKHKTPEEMAAAKTERLIDWNVSVVEDLVKKLLAYREQTPGGLDPRAPPVWIRPANKTPRDEVVDAIPLQARIEEQIPAHEIKAVKLPMEVTQQLHSFISAIAHSHHSKNQYHNFEHTSHVLMTLRKLLQRVAASKQLEPDEQHCYSFGLDSDPLGEIAILFAAMIHNIDHPGVSNAQLALYDPEMNNKFHGKSLNEQSSLEFGWNLFMMPSYAELRSCLFASQNDLNRFRQILVNLIMATDISDAELQQKRDERWKQAFNNSNGLSITPANQDLKATVLLEHIVQASVVCHTMQRWTIYQKWNTALFEERATAFLAGKTSINPADHWFDGELHFLDHFVIPLAKKFKEQKTLGEYSIEFVSCACNNREEWVTQGYSVMQELCGTYLPPEHQPSVKVEAPPPPPPLYVMTPQQNNPVGSPLVGRQSPGLSLSSSPPLAADAAAGVPPPPTQHEAAAPTPRLSNSSHRKQVPMETAPMREESFSGADTTVVEI